MKAAKGLLIGASIALAVVVAGGCSANGAPQGGVTASPGSSSAAASTGGSVQSNTGGKVTIDVEWLGLDNGALTFRVAMNTHSVDLDGYDLMDLSVLRDDMGNEYYPESWDSRPGGHHRKGTLTFPVPDSVNQRETEYVELIIRDVAGIENRTLTWMME